MELKEYENAVAAYVSGLNIKKMPLTSWNFYAENFERTVKILSDANLLKNIAKANSWTQEWDLQNELYNETIIVVTCSKLKIVFASKNIQKMNGYRPEEVIGNSPKMFQGEATDSLISKQIGEAIINQKPFDKVVVNYKKDGSLYKCHIKGFPIFNKNGKLMNFIAFEKAA